MDAFVQLSLLAAFIAGMVALFAPCCISFLLPSYFANVFKEKKRVVWMTLIYSLGIFTVMLPVVLGARLLSQFFYSMHDQAYVIGGLFMVAVGFMALFGVKLPMPKFSTNRQAGDPLSTYILGIFSGITSSCCAPVLIGVLALTSLTPTTAQSLLVGFFYVLGMVTPLFLASLFIDKRNLLEKPVMRKKVTEFSVGEKVYEVTLASMISFLMFVGIGILTIFLSLSGKLAMDQTEESVAQAIQEVAIKLTEFVSLIPGLDLVFFIGAVILLAMLMRYIKKED